MRHALGRSQEGVLLADQLAAELAEVHRQDLAGIGRGEGDLLLAAPRFGEHGHEQALAGQQALAGAHQRAEEAALLLLRCRRRRWSPSAMPSSMYIMPPASATVALARVELDFDELHVVAEDPVVDLVRPPSHRWRRAAAGAMAAAATAAGAAAITVPRQRRAPPVVAYPWRPATGPCRS